VNFGPVTPEYKKDKDVHPVVDQQFGYAAPQLDLAGISMPRGLHARFCHAFIVVGVLFERKHSVTARQPTTAMHFSGTDIPQKYPFLWLDLDTLLKYGSLGPFESSSQMASRSVYELMGS